MPVLSAVSVIALRIARWTYLGVRAIGESNGRPIHWIRTFSSLSSATRPNSFSCSPRMCRTSGRGRCQFSVEKPNTVSQPMLRCTAIRTSRARFSSPSVCPSVRGSPRRPAHRPLPSMMQATCRRWSGEPDDTGSYASQPTPRRAWRGRMLAWLCPSRSTATGAPRRDRARAGDPTRQLLRHIMVVGGTLRDWEDLGDRRWDERVERLGAVADQAGASFLTLRAFEPGIDPVDLQWWERQVGSCHVIVDPCGDGRQRFAEAMQRTATRRTGQRGNGRRGALRSGRL